MSDYTGLQAAWFVLISILWIGYFVLEGFDFGVGILLRAVSRDDAERRAVLHSIGPIWDGNEVWLIVAGGATFAAFPQWYATLFSGFYLALFLILVALIVRNVSFEFWGKGDSKAWRDRWEWALLGSSLLVALLWGVAWANIVHGVPIDHAGEFTGNFSTLLNPYGLLGGLTTLAIFIAHGAVFLSLKTKGEPEVRARRIAAAATPVAAVLGAGFLAWTVANQSSRGGVDPGSAVLAVLALVAFAGAAAITRRNVGERANGLRAFAATAVGIVLLFAALFVDLFPHVMVSSTDQSFSLTLNAASSSHYTLVVMTVVAGLMLPLVLLYQAWTYWVFRHRIGAEDFGEVRSPLDLLDARRPGEGGEPPEQSRPTAP
jgi:cytochrome d ubiquinol oxidase subunit II